MRLNLVACAAIWAGFVLIWTPSEQQLVLYLLKGHSLVLDRKGLHIRFGLKKKLEYFVTIIEPLNHSEC